VPTKRRRLANRQIGIANISPAAVEARLIGDWHGLYEALGIDARVPSPFDVGEDDDPEDPPRGLFASTEPPGELWCRALVLRRRLIELAGKPGRVGRHGEPLGPA
jgi:hypothetical protein